MSRRPLIAGNWKMNSLKQEAIDLSTAIAEKYAQTKEPKCDVLVCPPSPYLFPVVEAVENRIFVGSQDAHFAVSGAHTGDISAAMVKDTGAKFAIVGHSERRTDHFETDEIVNKKSQAVIKEGLIAVICIGETEKQRDEGKTIEVCSAQIQGSIPENATAENVVIAYEPVWAIGTGRTPTTQDVADVHGAIREEIAKKLSFEIADKMRILYGGSVKPSNAKELMALKDVDGALVGGASLTVEDFYPIIETCL